MREPGPSRRAREITAFQVMEIMEAAKRLEAAGASVIHLEVGEPDFPTPACVLKAARKAMRAGRTRYTHSLGLPELREEIARRYAAEARVPPSPDQILVTAGTSPGMLLLFAALLEPGDEVILSDPGYSCYPNMIKFAGGRPVYVAARAADGFQVDPEEIARAVTPRTRGIVVNSPSNPTGAVLDDERMAAIADLGVPLIADEIYHGLVYGPPCRTALAYADAAFVIDGFSKRYAMTGWRLGYVIVPPAFVRPIQKLAQNFYISANDFIQWAALAALREAGPDVERMAAVYDERRRFLGPALRRLGFDLPNEGRGAFYLFAGIRSFAGSSQEFVDRLLAEAHVAVAPGSDFGPGGEGFARFSYAASLDVLAEAVRRIEAWIRRKA
ncbi:MAG TPA: pyridoxal phosphate-dependent aminotransferase [Planctomycetota bacterium]|jgi:aspartate/methionine/tyrosine aminotransferase|nr:pyridoxal phosphate-dependent aminotransferase [Planctomycetota bacterium]OQC20912.1 MAG: Aspartate aminotransferase [Planctomycetes bacterium ADurb.Bin069]HNR98408.1 pyridoxal phosphate-dependent aminotransferase [Planctomycetota bacterium]HNU25172.1 pyridoxal phosphate-dependent aminotransferase [Planctomycetota bacterium]HOE30160.1 pyridoxal phosphate-dependent aminotransferase [Planctomycetota bacterium]